MMDSRFSRFNTRALLLAGVLWGVTALAAVPETEQALTQGMSQFRQGRVSVAYARFAQLADEGDAEAARIALMMLRHGPAMFGTKWSASQPQIERWRALAASAIEPLPAESGD